MHTNTRKLDERSPQRLSSMKSAKETQSPIHSTRTHEELENRMSSNSVSNILGLNVEGTLMRMDDQGLCHIVIAHNDPLYSETVMKRLTRLHIEGQTLQWEGEVISLDSIRLTQRAHPSNMKELQVDDHFEFPPLSSSTTNALQPPSIHEPEIEIGKSDTSSYVSSKSNSSQDMSMTSNSIGEVEITTLEDIATNNQSDYIAGDLVDTDEEEAPQQSIPFAHYPPGDKKLARLPKNTDTVHSTKVTFHDDKSTSVDKDSTSRSSSHDSLISPTPSSRNSTVVDIDTGTATVFQKRATAAALNTTGEQWIEQSTTYQRYDNDHNRDEALEDALELDQDDINTISSDTTSHYKNHEEANKEEAPPSTRYQIGFQIDDEDLDTLLKECANHDDDTLTFPDTLSKTKALITSFFQQAKSLDNGFAIISWADASTFDMIRSTEDIPSDTVKFASFCKGFRPRQTTGRMYLRLRLHAPTIGQTALDHGMTEWSRLSGCTFYKTVIQAENATSIGWFVYSSQHSNLNSLMSHLAVKTGYEWGYKLGACTAADSMVKDVETDEQVRTQWKDRVKALFIYVPHDKAMEAKLVIANLMEINSDTVTKQIPELSDKFLFMHPERQMSDEPSKQYYQQIVTKHISHCKHLRISIANIFDQPIDQPVVTRAQDYISLRQLVLSIRVSDKHSDFFNASLFHGLDFTEDSGKVYLNGLPGPGGPAYIFSFYEPMAAAAEEMIQGLGIYAGRIYGNRAMNPCFTESHWNGNQGWQWNKQDGIFLTPATRQREANLRFDPNLAIEKLARMDSLAIDNAKTKSPVTIVKPTTKKKKRGRKSKKGKRNQEVKDDDSATYIDPLKVKEKTLLRKVMNHDDDSQIQHRSAGHVKKKEVTQVFVPAADDVSIASTLTMGSIIEHRAKLPGNAEANSPTSSVNSTETSMSSLKSITNPDYFKSMINEGMTEKEIRDRASTFYQHQVNKAQIEHQRALEKYLSSLQPTAPPVVTPHKSKQSGSFEAGGES
jgi:hypothetical protein